MIQLIQQPDQAINVFDWRRDEEFAEYPEGARDKTLLYCLLPAPYQYLKEGRYLFKRSSPRYPEQFWVEILAYRIGIQMDISVPPAFVAYDSKQNQSGALIEWFLDPILKESYIPGGDYCQQYIPRFDRKKGKQHNFETVSQIFIELNKKHPHFNTDWKSYWAKAFTFDALIGNTDRHQDNWGIIVTSSHSVGISNEKMRISPVFDNGTSMGHEIFPSKFKHYEDATNLEKYVSKGWHQMKWGINDTASLGHIEMVKKFANKYPETRHLILDCLKRINYDAFKSTLDTLTTFDVPVRLTAERAAFMLRLLQFRHQHLLQELEK